MTDPISDMLARIRNAIAVGKNSVTLPHSTIKEDLANVLVKSGFLQSAKVQDGAKAKELVIEINPDTEAAKITHLRRLSRPGQRNYTKSGAIPKIRQGRGLVVVSTSQGLMTGDEAKSKKLGGELLCEVY